MEVESANVEETTNSLPPCLADPAHGPPSPISFTSTSQKRRRDEGDEDSKTEQCDGFPLSSTSHSPHSYFQTPSSSSASHPPGPATAETDKEPPARPLSPGHPYSQIAAMSPVVRTQAAAKQAVRSRYYTTNLAVYPVQPRESVAASSPTSTRFSSSARASDATADSTAASSLSAVAEDKDETAGPPSSNKSKFRLPLRLPRPANVQSFDFNELQSSTDLAGVPYQYILDRLQHQGPSLLRAVTACSVRLPPSPTSALPSFVSVQVPTTLTDEDGHGATPPDYALAATSDSTTQTLLLPVHGLVMATNCKSFSLLANQPPAPSSPQVAIAKWDWSGKDAGITKNLPVVHIHLPSSEAFSLLVPYFYTASAAALLSSLLPLRLAAGHSADPASSLDLLLSDTPKILAARLSVIDQAILMEHVNLVHAVWQTAVALGAARDPLWKTLDVTWSVLLGAIAIKDKRAAC